ncbi:MAG: hypothetical protein AAFQ98_02000 [Bacteroidota bacterium]
MKKLALFLALGLVFNLAPVGQANQVEATYASCFDNDSSGIQQDLCAGSCAGEVFRFRAAVTASSYSWSIIGGGTIVSGQNSRILSVQAPAWGGIGVRLEAGGVTYLDLAEYSFCE